MGPVYEPHWLARTLRLVPPWSGQFHGDLLRIGEKGRQEELHVLDVETTVSSNWPFSRLDVMAGEKARKLSGLRHAVANDFAKEVEARKRQALARLASDLSRDLSELRPVFDHIADRLRAPRYLASLERYELVQFMKSHEAHIRAAAARAHSVHAKRFPKLQALANFLPKLVTLVRAPEDLLDHRNEQFVREEWKLWKPFFEKCEKTELSEEQGRAAIVWEDATLLVAAAGSGKTSSVVGKVAYLLAKGLAAPGEILCLAFNSGAASEIEARLRERLTFILSDACQIDERFKVNLRQVLSEGGDVAAMTFHKFGLSIIRQVEGRDPRVVQGSTRSRLLADAIEDCKKDPRFFDKWWLYQAVYRFALPSNSRFQNQEEYDEYLHAIKRERRQEEGISTMGTTRLVRSLEEAAISNWLYTQGVHFEYEASFSQGAAILCPGKTWSPDFSYRVRTDQGSVLIVHEHFAINDQGHAPSFFQDPAGYVRQAEQKQRVLRGLDERHFWTTSAEYRDGTLFDTLRKHLERVGVVFNPPSETQKLKRLEEIGLEIDNELLEQAVSQIRANEWSRADLEKRIIEQPEFGRATVFLELAIAVAERLTKLMEDRKVLDFDSMIQKAVGYLRVKPELSPYRVILADEFQDTAAGRAKLIRESLKGKQDARLFGVGDDWQAINRFAGSDISLFTGFGESFSPRPGGYARCDLTKTFRTNQGIADISTAFVLKNKSQLPKDVTADDSTWRGVLDIRTYRQDEEVFTLLDEQIRRWVDAHPPGNRPSILLLGRNRPKYLKGIDDEQVTQLMEKWQLSVDFVPDKDGKPSLFHSMHGSKGRQADYVAILGMHRIEHDFFCFPSEREEDPLLQLVLPAKENLPDAEERRLFYVALTRAKRQVALVTQLFYPSNYVLEILKDHRRGHVLFNGETALPEICPRCEKSVLVREQDAETQQWMVKCGSSGARRGACRYKRRSEAMA